MPDDQPLAAAAVAVVDYWQSPAWARDNKVMDSLITDLEREARAYPDAVPACARCVDTGRTENADGYELTCACGSGESNG